MEKPLQYKFKLCLIGEKAVGKTSLINRFVLNEYDNKYITTIGGFIPKVKIN